MVVFARSLRLRAAAEPVNRAFGGDVADLQLAVALGANARSVSGVSDADLEPTVADRLDDAIVKRCGRDGDILRRGYRLTVYEAGWATMVLPWNVRSELHHELTSFRQEHILGRLDLVFRDLLEHPEDPPSREWAASYGYASTAALSRALRQYFGFGLGDVRRMGRLGQWVASATRTPCSERGLAREAEANARMAAFRAATRSVPLGTHGRRAVRELGTRVCDNTPRPRYPAVSAVETARLAGDDAQ